MTSTFIGLDADKRRVFLSPDVRCKTHMHVIGGSGTGKSKFLEWLIREDIINRRGLCVIDWHGSLCDEVLAWCHHNDIGIYEDTRSLIILNPSKPDFITGFNPFVSNGADITTQISNRIDAMIRPWGITNTDEMPTFERVCRALFAFMIEMGETLPNAAKLLEFDAQRLREYAISEVREPHAASIWREIQRISTDKKSGQRDWSGEVRSTQNRLARFIGSLAVRRFMGLRTGNIDLGEAMDDGSIILVNLARSEFLPKGAGRVFASLLLNQFFEATMRRAKLVRTRRARLRSISMSSRNTSQTTSPTCSTRFAKAASSSSSHISTSDISPTTPGSRRPFSPTPASGPSSAGSRTRAPAKWRMRCSFPTSTPGR